MHRPRHRRRDPQRTGPIRNAGEALRDGESWRGSARQRDDAASCGVREGYRVIEEQIRRGRHMAQELDDDPWSDDERPIRGRRRHSRYSEEPRSRYGEEPGSGEGLWGMPLRQMERLIREILLQIVSMRPNPWRLAELLFRLQIEAIAWLARLGFGAFGMAAPRRGNPFEEDLERIHRDIEELSEDEDLEGFEEVEETEEDVADGIWDWPAAPGVPTVIRAKVPLPVYVWSHERTEIDVELPPGAPSLDLMIEPPLATSADQPALPAFDAELVPLVDGPVILRIEVPRDLPAGRYLRRILVRATGEPVGDLTVQVGDIATARAPRARSVAKKKEKKR